MYKNNSLYYNKKWQSSDSINSFSYLNLKKQKIIVRNCNKKDINNLLESSVNAYKIWKHRTYQERSKLIYKIGKIILKYKNILATEESIDTGKPISQCISEIEYCSSLWLHASKSIKRVQDNKIRINKKTVCRIYYEPAGIAAIIVPWNSPQIVLSERLPYILAAGCVGIIKPSEFANGGLIKFIEIINKIEIGAGVINLLTGNSITSNWLINHKKINIISFAGSSQTGKKIMRSASKDLKRVSLEMGGKNPFIIFDDANINKAVRNAITSFSLNSGQCCVGASRIFVEKKIINKVLNYLKKNLDKNKQVYKLSNYKNYNNVFNYLKKRRFKKENIFYGSIPKKKKINIL